MFGKRLNHLASLLDDREAFVNSLELEDLNYIANNVLFLYQTLKNSQIVAILLDYGIDYSLNKYELVEVAINRKYSDTLSVFINYYDDLDSLFEWGFERGDSLLIDYSINTKNYTIDNNYKRMSRYFLINSMDKNMVYIFLKVKNFTAYYIEGYNKNVRHSIYYKKDIKIKKI